MLPEIEEKFQFDIDLFMEALKERIQELLPDLSPEEQQDTPILMSDSAFATCLIEVNRAMAINEYSIYGGEGCIFKCDISLSNNNLTFALGDFVGITSTWVDYWNDRNVILENANHWKWNIAHEGKITAAIWDTGFEFDLYYEGAYHDTDISLDWNIPLELADCKQYSASAPVIRTGNSGVISYSVDEDEVITCTPDRDLQPNSFNNIIFAIKGYPFVCNASDITYINQFVNNNDATNNYNTTYTTPDNKTITVYYGDNYVITHVDDDEPVSYNDIKNALNIAVNQINDDNDIDMNVPDYPIPEPPGPVTDDDYIDMGLGVETDGMAMYNMAVITRDDLIQLISDFEANADTGLSFIPHVLGLYKLGIESSQLLTTKSEQIKLHKEPNGTSAFTSVENYNIVDEQLTIIDCGSITIDREELLTNTFYDYSPYSTYEMFIPGCGWITLPDTIVGRTISVSIVFDLTTCSCKGIVRSEGQLLGGSGTTLATVNGIIGSSVPLSINETGLQRAAIFNGSTQAAMALGTAFLGVGIGNPYMGASGVAMAAGALADNHVAGNTTYTNTKGGATDYSVFGDGYKAVLKITRPVVEIPDNYGHTVGFVVNEYGLLGDFHGFTVCVNPHVHISATSDEKEEIKRLLESGVILPDGE